MAMNELIKNNIKEFILEGIDEKPFRCVKNPFWQSLKKTGTELWLDTGDIDEAKNIWTSELTALTTNNTLLNNEIQKGIYDNFILKAKEIVKGLPLKEQIIEIAFILNARHGLRLAKIFEGNVSVELHTDTAHDLKAIVDYGIRYFEICPTQFIIKVPYTATGLIGARKLRELGVKINFTLEFSARQNVLVAMVTKPNYLNVFLGRLGAYVKDNGLGDGTGVGERTVLSTQKWITELTANNEVPTKLIAASLRNTQQLKTLAGVDVYTIPTKVAMAAQTELDGSFSNQLNSDNQVNLFQDSEALSVEKLWKVSHKELLAAQSLDAKPPLTGKELVKRMHESGCGDMFPHLSENDLRQIALDGKIPDHQKWIKHIKNGDLAIDTLLNIAGLASFTADQAQLDNRIKKIIY